MRGARRVASDQGFLMAEVVAAMTVFAVLVVAALAILVRTTSAAGQNLRRTAAANLLTRQLEAVQGVRAAKVPQGRTTSTTTVGNVPYTIQQDVSYVSSTDGASLCDTGDGSLLYKLVTVKVTWAGMQTMPPVRGDVLKGLGIGSEGSDAARGALAVLVQDASGAPLGGAQVDLGGGATQTTDSQGCTVFLDLTPGAYYPHATNDGGHSNGWSSGVTVNAGGISRTTLVVYPPPPPPPPAPTPPPNSGGSSSDPVPDPGSSDPSGGSTGGDTSGPPFDTGGGGGTSTPPPPPPPVRHVTAS